MTAITSSDPVPAARLRCTGVTKQFPGVVAVKDLDFEAEGGQVHAILGENGAGKSTFIKILGGAVRPDAGVVELDGASLASDSPRGARHLGVSLAFQELSLVPDMTVAQNVWIGASGGTRLGVLPAALLRKRTLDLWHRLEAPAVDPDAVVRRLSFADRQVVEVVKAVAANPRVLVLDESTAGLPAAETEWILTLARDAARRGTVVLFISHRMPEIRRVADRVTILRDGEAVITSDVARLTDDEIIEAMLGRKPQRLFPPRVAEPEDTVDMSVTNLSVGDRVRDVNFTLRRGEILGLGGLQGQGQSTLLLALFGVVRSHGEVVIGGHRARLSSPRAALRAGIGLALVPEDRRDQGLLLTKSVRENVTLANLGAVTRWGFLSSREERRLAREAVAQMEIRLSTIEQLVSSLSGGNQQKVVIAKLLSVGAKVLLFHDLTRGIDIGTKAEIFQLARSLAASGHSIVFYSSDNQELTGLCDRILVMRAGQIAAELRDDLSEEAIMRAALAVPEAEVA